MPDAGSGRFSCGRSRSILPRRARAVKAAGDERFRSEYGIILGRHASGGGEPLPRSDPMDEAGGLYAKLEERVLARDQLGSTQVFYDLVKNGRPRTEVLREIVRIHAPYTHVPYHQRIDDGFVRFVNNDQCL